MLTDKFFNHVRQHLGGGSLSENAVNGINILVRTWLDEGGVLKDAHLAYVLGSCWHETDKFKYTHEIGEGKGRKYGEPEPNGFVYYGRGFIQLTWGYNYKAMGQRLSLPLYDNPELATDYKTAAKIAVIGMKEGLFTGKKMSDFPTFKEMRRVVNSIDKSDLIAGYAFRFQEALALNDAGLVVSREEKSVTSSKTIASAGSIIAGAGSTIVVVNQALEGAKQAANAAKEAMTTASGAANVAQQAIDKASHSAMLTYALMFAVIALGGYIILERYKKIKNEGV